MDRTVICIAAFMAIVGSVSALNCTTLPDGSYEVGCRSFSKCVGGKRVIVDCTEQQVYNNNTGLCDDPAKVVPPCGQLIDCKGKAEGRYADLDQNCKTWYTCYDDKFLGHNFCPAGTVFDEKLETCNWEDAVPPPCGTYSSGK